MKRITPVPCRGVEKTDPGLMYPKPPVRTPVPVRVVAASAFVAPGFAICVRLKILENSIRMLRLILSRMRKMSSRRRICQGGAQVGDAAVLFSGIGGIVVPQAVVKRQLTGDLPVVLREESPLRLPRTPVE